MKLSQTMRSRKAVGLACFRLLWLPQLLGSGAMGAQDSDDLCGIQAYAHGYNSSGSMTIDGFRVNNTYPETDWTWTRYVSNEIDDTTNQSSLWQTFGLETRPDMNLSSPTLPYTGCIIVPASIMVSGREDDGTCSAILSSGCIAEMVKKVNASASSFSGTHRGSAATFSCPQLIQSITRSSTSKCHDQWTGSISTEFLPNSFSDGPISARRCLPQENSTGHPFFGWGKAPRQREDFKYYDHAIRTPHPVIVAVWLKATKPEPDEIGVDKPGWADTRVFCVPANNTEPGSRSLSVANKAAGVSGAGRTASIAPAITGLMGAVIMWVLVGVI